MCILNENIDKTCNFQCKIIVKHNKINKNGVIKVE